MPKRGAQGNGTIRQRPDGRWEARFTIGRDPGTGKQVQRSIYADTQGEVRKKLSAAVKAIDECEYAEPSKMTLSQWLDIWTSEYLGAVKYGTQRQYKHAVNSYINPALGAIKVSALAPHTVQKFYNKLGETLSSKTVRDIHGVLSKALTVALKSGYVKSNPCALVELPRVERPEIPTLTDSQVAALLSECERTGDVYGRLITLILFTGLRISEALGLTWSAVDLLKGQLTIDRQLQKRPERDGGFSFVPPKSDKPRIIRPAQHVIDILRTRKREQAVERLRAGKLWDTSGGTKEPDARLVFTNPLGGHLHPQTVHRHVKSIGKAIDVPELYTHSLRHVYAVLSLQNGDDPLTVARNCGHASVAFTLDVYGSVSEKMRDDHARRMDLFIESLKGETA